MDKANIYHKMITKGMIQGNSFDTLLNLASQLGSDMDKASLYRNLLDGENISEDQWVALINKSAELGSDMEKSNLLIEIARKMPKTEVLKTACQKGAKSIGNDSDYGRVLRAIP
jgi:hypothetical protein